MRRLVRRVLLRRAILFSACRSRCRAARRAAFATGRAHLVCGKRTLDVGGVGARDVIVDLALGARAAAGSASRTSQSGRTSLLRLLSTVTFRMLATRWRNDTGSKGFGMNAAGRPHDLLTQLAKSRPRPSPPRPNDRGRHPRPAWNDYLLIVACKCGVVFERWVTPEDAEVDLLRAARLN